jgi:hypothetical protein
MYTYFCYVPRPTSVDKVRVNPSDLRAYQMAYQMLGPCCLCPFINVMGPDFVEAAIYMVSVGPHAGQYIASCARDLCGYFGK